MGKRKGRAPAENAQAPMPGKRLGFLEDDIVFLLVIIALAFVIRYVSLDATGITFDEPIYVLAGPNYLTNLLHFDYQSPFWSYNMEHPPISKYVYGAAIWLLAGHSYDFGTYLAARLASVILGVFTCVIVYLIGRDFFGREVGFTSAIILSLLPPFLAHTQIAAIDAPLVFFVTLTMYLFMLAVKSGSRTYYLASAVSFGLTLGTKFNGVLILPVMALLFLLYQAGMIRAKEGKIDLEAVRKNLPELLPVVSAVAFIGIAALVFFGIWPWLWTDPIGHLQQSLNHWSYPIQEYFLGSKGPAPLYYYPVYFAVTLPLLLFLPLAAGVICVARSRDPFKVGILLWFALPFAYNFTGFIQDGVRYLLMIYPAVALLCTIGLLWAARTAGAWLRERFEKVTSDHVFTGLTVLIAIYLLISALSVYPYYLDYYNVLAGGPKNVEEHKLFKIGWWGEGIKECMDWVGGTAPAGASVMMLTLPEDPSNTAFFTHDQYYIYPQLGKAGGTQKAYNFTQEPYVMIIDGVQKPITPDYVIINEKMWDDYDVTLNDSAYVLVYQASVQGAPLAQVYRKSG